MNTKPAYTLVLLILLAASSVVLCDSAQCILGPPGGRGAFGEAVGASDDLDSLDVPLSVSPYINIGVYHDTGSEGWTGPAGFYQSDLRAPLKPVLGAYKTWLVHYWNTPSAPSGWNDTELTWHFADDDTLGSYHVEYRLTFVSLPQGVADWPPSSIIEYPSLRETVLLNNRSEGSWALRTYRTENGLDGYVFAITATVVPEPSSLSILSLALASAGAWRLRRRR